MAGEKSITEAAEIWWEVYDGNFGYPSQTLLCIYGGWEWWWELRKTMTMIITAINVIVVVVYIIINLEQPRIWSLNLIVHNGTDKHNFKISTSPTHVITNNLGLEWQQQFPKPIFSISFRLAIQSILQERKPQSWQESTIFISQLFMFFKGVLLLH